MISPLSLLPIFTSLASLYLFSNASNSSGECIPSSINLLNPFCFDVDIYVDNNTCGKVCQVLVWSAFRPQRKAPFGANPYSDFSSSFSSSLVSEDPVLSVFGSSAFSPFFFSSSMGAFTSSQKLTNGL